MSLSMEKDRLLRSLSETKIGLKMPNPLNPRVIVSIVKNLPNNDPILGEEEQLGKCLVIIAIFFFLKKK